MGNFFCSKHDEEFIQRVESLPIDIQKYCINPFLVIPFHVAIWKRLLRKCYKGMMLFAPEIQIDGDIKSIDTGDKCVITLWQNILNDRTTERFKKGDQYYIKFTNFYTTYSIMLTFNKKKLIHVDNRKINFNNSHDEEDGDSSDDD